MKKLKRDLVQSFLDWTKRKIVHHVQQRKKSFHFNEGQVWWAALGKNIGVETDGKHRTFNRPVLILKKYNKDICFVLPFTTQVKYPIPWYQVLVSGHDKKRVVNITQGRAMSSKRLLHRQSIIPLTELRKIQKIFAKQFL